MRSRAAVLLFTFLSTCDDTPSAEGGCTTDDDCPWGDRCVDATCLPTDLCGAGIYVADTLPQVPDPQGDFPPDALVRLVRGSLAGVGVQEGTLVIDAAEPKRFEVDFYDEPLKNLGRAAPIGVFMEARLRVLAGAGDCVATLELWPEPGLRARFCLGNGGVRTQAGGALLVDVDLAAFHTWRLEVKPAFTEETGVLPVAELWVDGEPRIYRPLPRFDPVPLAERPPRAPLLAFGTEGGTVQWDFVRWGCQSAAGPCPAAREGDDTGCLTERRPGPCGGGAVALEICDGRDDDCDGLADEDFRADFSDGTATSITIAGTERHLGDSCGLAGPCAGALVVCADDHQGLRCDTEQLARPERCDDLDNDCDGRTDEDFRAGPLTDPRALWSDEIVGELGLGLGEPCGQGVCAGGLVICNHLQDAATCSSRSARTDAGLCADGRDNDCDGRTDEGLDQDQDGYQSCPRCHRAGEVCVKDHDCDDTPETGVNIHPDQPETCNRRDDDCDSRIDEGLDADGDGFVPCGEGDPDDPPQRIDCDDDPDDDPPDRPRAEDIFPGALELCDGIDNNCNGDIDEDYATLVNGRRYYTARQHCGRCGVNCEIISPQRNTVVRCEIIEGDSPIDQYGCSPRCQPGFVDADGDIFTTEPNWHEESVGGCECELDERTDCDDPAADGCAERCDGEDNDCDDRRDEADDLRMPPCYTGPANTRNVGICHDGRVACIDGAPRAEVCRGEQVPLAPFELACDGLDEDCDGTVDEDELEVCDP